MTHSPNGVMQAAAVHGDCNTCFVYRIPAPLVCGAQLFLVHQQLLGTLLRKVVLMRSTPGSAVLSIV